MPLLQGQPFKLIKPPDVIPLDSEIYTIQHTGEKFLNKSDFEDRLALYSQNIWMCQCTGHSGLTHKEAWMSEAKTRVAARNAVPIALQKPLLSLVHHSLSPLEQLIDAASILCHSQYHVGEEVLLLSSQQKKVKIVNCKENSRMFIESCKAASVSNGLHNEQESSSLMNGNVNGASKSSDDDEISSSKENQAKDIYASRDDSCHKRDMLPKLYDVITVGEPETELIENVPSKTLSRSYKIPSKDQLRLFIRSCALRHRGSTCTPWVVSDDLVKKFSLSNKLPLFLSSSKRKSQSPGDEGVKRSKSESISKETSSKVPPLVIKSDSTPPQQKPVTPDFRKKDSTKFMANNGSNNVRNSFSPFNKIGMKSSWATVSKHPLSLGKPKVLPRPTAAATSVVVTTSTSTLPLTAMTKTATSTISSSSSSLPVSKMPNPPRRRGRPPLSQEEKERNKRLREATLLDFSNKLTNSDHFKIIKIKSNDTPPPPPPPQSQLSTMPTTTTSYLQPSNAVVASTYRSPIKRATTPESIMKLPIMRRYVHEHKTIKGVLGQFRRYAYTMDLVLSKLSPMQIELIPDETLKQDLYTRQKKVQDKKFFEKLTPDEKKQFLKDKARTVALERWKERKLKNLKVEDKLVPGLLPLPDPKLVETPELIPNAMFGDIVMVTEFIKCFRELLLGEEKFRIMSNHLMEAVIARAEGYQVIADMICCFLPTIIHDDISKNCKELGVPISTIPITYQTAHELARLCLTKQEEEETILVSEENYQLGKEQNELSDELLSKLECCELWELNCQEIIAVLRALVHKTLSTAAISVYVEEIEEKVLLTLRERRKFLKQVQKEQRAGVEKRKEERKQNKMAKDEVPKKKRGRPKGYSPKLGAMKPSELSLQKKEKTESLCETIHKRRMSAELLRKEKAESLKLEKERQKQLGEIQKRHSVDRKYEEIVFKRDNLLRKIPIGFDRDHNRYWIFHTTTPGLFVEKGWVDHNTDYIYSLHESSTPSPLMMVQPNPVKNEPKINEEAENKPLHMHISTSNNGYNMLKAEVKTEVKTEIKEELITDVQPTIKEMDEDNQTLSTVKSKLTLSPMKMTFRGRPPKETYVLVDEDTQTFPVIGENKWHCYRSMDDVMKLLSCLSDQGQRESQLIAAININRDRLQLHFNKKPEPLYLNMESVTRLKKSVKEDIIQIARELIEGWLGGIPSFEKWEVKAQKVDDVAPLGLLLIDVQKHMQIKNLKSIMAPVKREINMDTENGDAQPEYEDVEGPGVERWREAVRSCRTYSRLHVLVGVFDSCIKWEKSMATRKCKVCRNKMKETPLIICGKCENSYHWNCLRPPLKEDPGDSWSCPACMPKKTRREEESAPVEEEVEFDDQDEKDDPTFSLNRRGRPGRPGRPAGRSPGPGRPPGSITRTRKYNKRKTGPRPEKECVVCRGRVGLICCSQCKRPYHSECHDPPLLSRARKDWVCGACVNPNQAFVKGEQNGSAPGRRNYFGTAEEMSQKKRAGNRGPRDSFGRFLKGSFKRSYISGDAEAEASDREEDNGEAEETGRTVRGAKVKALENIVEKLGRRSSRNQHRRKNYKDESEDDSGGESNEDDSEEQSDEEEEENEGAKESYGGDNPEVIDISDGENESEEEGNKDNDSDDEGESETDESSDGSDVEEEKEVKPKPAQRAGSSNHTAISGGRNQSTILGNRNQATIPGNRNLTTTPGNRNLTTTPGNRNLTTIPGNRIQATTPGNRIQATTPGNRNQATAQGNCKAVKSLSSTSSSSSSSSSSSGSGSGSGSGSSTSGESGSDSGSGSDSSSEESDEEIQSGGTQFLTQKPRRNDKKANSDSDVEELSDDD